MNARTAKRLAWSSLGLYVVAGSSSTIVGFVAQGHITGGKGTEGWNGSSVSGGLLIGLTFVLFPIVGAIVTARRPTNSLGWVLVLIGLVLAVDQLLVTYAVMGKIVFPGRLPGADVAAAIDAESWVPMIVLMGVFVLLLFPDGHLPSLRWRTLAWVVGVGSALVFFLALISPGQLGSGPFTKEQNPLGIEVLKPVLAWLTILILVIPGGIIAAAVSVIGRFRRSRGAERLQMKWLVTAGAIIAALYAVAIAWSLSFDALNPHATSQPVALSILQNGSLLAFGLLPVAIGFAVLRYKLYEIDSIINKALVYGLLATFITGVYVAIVVGLGQVLGSQGNAALSIAATGLIAVVFQPIRERVRRFANRFVYGKRSTPYEIMAELSRRMADTPALSDLLPTMAATAASGVGAERSRVRVVLPGAGEQVTTWPIGTFGNHFDRVVAVSYEGERIGDISVAKPAGEPLTPAEDGLLTDLAAQAGLAMHNARLAASLEIRLAELDERSRQLEISRQRLVTARDAQRRGLERDIREGPQRQLLAIGQQLTHASTLVVDEPDVALSQLDHLGEEANATLEGLRDLARGIFPPLLADKGVASALDAHIRKVGAHATMDVSPAFNAQRFDVDTEACVYFCCLQAIQNVLRHAGNAPTTVGLEVTDHTLTFSVQDAGPGFDLGTTPEGMGIQIVRDRIAALDGLLTLDSSPGGGTTVTGRLPVALG